MRRTAQVGSVPIEHLAVIAVALLGVVGMTSLGGAAGAAIAGDATGDRAAHPMASPLSAQAGAAAAVADAAKGLYRGVKGKARKPIEFPALGNQMIALISRVAEGERLPLSEIKALTPDDTATAVLVHGLLTEYGRLLQRGEFAESQGWVSRELRARTEAALRALGGFNGGSTTGALPTETEIAFWGTVHMDGRPHRVIAENADYGVRLSSRNSVHRFLRRLKAADSIFRDGISGEELTRLFPDSSLGTVTVFRRGGPPGGVAAAEGLNEFFATFDGVFDASMLPAPAFAWRYLANPERALATLSEEARAYVNAEVLPSLTATYGAREAPRRYLTDEGEARVLARVVSGDVEGAKRALSGAKRSGAPALPDDMTETVEFAVRLFSGGGVPLGKLRAFSEEEAAALIRFSDEVIADLRSRADGGAVVADLAEMLRDRDWIRAAGRSEAHQTRVLERLLQSVARGSEDDFRHARALVSQVVADFGKELTDDLREVLVRFRGDAVDGAQKPRLKAALSASRDE